MCNCVCMSECMSYAYICKRFGDLTKSSFMTEPGITTVHRTACVFVPIVSGRDRVPACVYICIHVRSGSGKVCVCVFVSLKLSCGDT